MALCRTINHLRLLVIFVISLELIGVVLHLKQMGLLKQILSGELVSTAEVNKSTSWGNMQFIVHLALYSFACLFFLRWTYVSQFVSKKVNAQPLKSLVQVILLWIIPIANLIRPIQYISEILLRQYPKSDVRALKSYQTTIKSWWILWLISGPIGRFFIYISYPDTNLDRSLTYLILYIIIELLSILTGVLFMVILSRQYKFIRRNSDGLATMH